MAKKRGVKISTSSTLLNKKNIIFMLILVLLLIMIIYFSIKAWPIMKERLGDEDDDGIKNYQDKCISTPEGTTVDQYGCEITEEKTHRESPTYVKPSGDEEPTEDTSIVCSDTDGGKDIWKKGICDDGSRNSDYCKENFESRLYEYECLSNICNKHKIECSDHDALCYEGKCIEETKDSDGDDYPDLDEYEEGTDPDNPDDYPGSEPTDGQSDCSSRCLGLGYIRGTGPYDSMGHCTYPEVGVYLSGNSGDICCCKDCDKWCKSGGWNYGTVTTSSDCSTYPTNHYDDDLGCCCHMEMSVQETDSDNDGIPDSTDTDDDNDGYTDSEENNAGTDPLNPNDYPEEETSNDEQNCQQWMTSKEYYDYWVLGKNVGVQSATGCDDYAFRECYDLGKPHAISAYNLALGCCIWSCKDEVEPPICTDTDGGDNIYVKGTVTGNNPTPFSFTDECTDDTYLMENWCTEIPSGPTFGGGVKKCNYGCEDGACKEISWHSGDLIYKWVVGHVFLDAGETVTKYMDLDEYDAAGQHICINIGRNLAIYSSDTNPLHTVNLKIYDSYDQLYTISDYKVFSADFLGQIGSLDVPHSGYFNYVNGKPFKFVYENNKVSGSARYTVVARFKIC